MLYLKEMLVLHGSCHRLSTLKNLVKKVLPPSLVRVVKQRASAKTGESQLLKVLIAEYAVSDWIVDIGANDGITASNSFPFILAGWHAILIEPAPAVFAKLIANHGARSNVTCLQMACSDKAGEADLFFGSDGEEGAMSTLSRTDNEWFRGARSTASVKVKTDTITNILRQYSVPHRLGILSVDCEGMDYEALLGLDFDQFRPAIVVTEEYEWEPEKHAAKYGLLIRAGYSLVQKIGCNTIWLDRKTEKH
jgi:FkbM family methyltransferase